MGFDCVLAAGALLASVEDADSRGLGAALGGAVVMVEYEPNSLPECLFLQREWIRSVKITVYGSLDPLVLNINIIRTVYLHKGLKTGPYGGCS